MNRFFSCALAALVATCALAPTGAQAAVPPDIEAGLQRIGRIVDPACTAKLYRPLMPRVDITSDAQPLYPGISIARNVAFGPDARDVVDIFSADKGAASRPVLVYVPGGLGQKIEIQAPEAHAFYDNIARWATKHGMVGVLMQRHPGLQWDDGAKDVARMIAFLRSNIAAYHGDATRIVLWAHSAGNLPVATYIGRPELWGPDGVGVEAAILMSAAQFNILPLKVEAPPREAMQRMLALGGKTCDAGGPASSDAPLPGRAPGEPGGAAPAPAAAQPPAPADEATQLARSTLPALKASTVRIMLANGELDVGTDPAQGNLMPFSRLLHDELCREGPAHCPELLVAKGHSHMSLVFSIDTPDTTVSAPVLAFIRGARHP
jgi:triacylglycerol lipase